MWIKQMRNILEQYPEGTAFCMRCKRPKGDQFFPQCYCREGNQMPLFYSFPLGGPVYWQDDLTGVLPEAVQAFLAHRTGQGNEPTAVQIKLVADYCNYYICAPCWEGADVFRAELQSLRVRSRTLATSDDVDDWIGDCLEIGIDPL